MPAPDGNSLTSSRHADKHAALQVRLARAHAPPHWLRYSGIYWLAALPVTIRGAAAQSSLPF